MKNMRVKVIYTTYWDDYGYGIFDGRKILVDHTEIWQTKKSAIRNAKAMAKRIGIKYDSEIIKQHGC